MEYRFIALITTDNNNNTSLSKYMHLHYAERLLHGYGNKLGLAKWFLL
jgi:hypothetical protein